MVLVGGVTATSGEGTVWESDGGAVGGAPDVGAMGNLEPPAVGGPSASATSWKGLSALKTFFLCMSVKRPFFADGGALSSAWTRVVVDKRRARRGPRRAATDRSASMRMVGLGKLHFPVSSLDDGGQFAPAFKPLFPAQLALF